jgi:Bacteriocin class II with double-glycine leader peptide
MERDMSETNHTSRLATLEEHDTIEDTELDAVTGGNAVNGAVTGALAGAATGCTKANSSGSWLGAFATAMGQLMNSRL